MNTTNDPRLSQNRRQSERRHHERRTIQYPYGSPEWIANIQQNYLLWPKQDRRQRDRRCQERRYIMNERRTGQSGRRLYRKKSIQNLQDLLTEEEKQMLLKPLSFSAPD